MPGRLTSKVYLALPLALAGPSTRLIRLPMSFLSPASGQSYLHLGMCFASLHGLGGLQHGLPNPDVRPTAAEISPQSLFDLIKGGVGMFVQEGLARHDKTGRAKAALLRVVFDKGGHDGMQLAILRKPFDGHDVMALRLYGEQVARIDWLVIKHDCAGATDPAIAHLLGPC